MGRPWNDSRKTGGLGPLSFLEDSRWVKHRETTPSGHSVRVGGPARLVRSGRSRVLAHGGPRGADRSVALGSLWTEVLWTRYRGWRQGEGEDARLVSETRTKDVYDPEKDRVTWGLRRRLSPRHGLRETSRRRFSTTPLPAFPPSPVGLTADRSRGTRDRRERGVL